MGQKIRRAAADDLFRVSQGDLMFEVLKYFGVSDIAYNQPKSPPRTPGANIVPGVGET